MNVSQLKQEVKRMFGDESGVQITDSDIVTWINAGQRQIVLQNEGLLEKTVTANSVLGQSQYSVSSIASDFLVVRGLMYKGAADTSYFRLKGMPLNTFNEVLDGWNGNTSTQGTPLYYTIFEESINLFPVPDSTITGAIKLFYNRKPVSVVNDTDSPDLPELYHDSLVNYCLMRAYELDEDFDAATAKGKQVDSDMKFLRGRDDWKQQETYPTITVLGDDLW